MSEVVLSSIHKSYGNLDVITDVDLNVEAGEFVVFVGPSGCGKSTLLRMIAGLESITSGKLHIGGTLCNDIHPGDRGVAMVFQSYALYPHMTVADNIGFNLKVSGLSRSERTEKIKEAARILQIEHLLDRKPSQLSGGQRQRVAIGRAIVREPYVFLFDEPLSNLDAALRVDMRMELSALHRELGATMIYVTHDQVEAMTLADKIVVLNAGEVQQVGTPLELYRAPKNLFVAGFIGSPKMNFLPVQVRRCLPGAVEVSGPALAPTVVPTESAGLAPGDALTLGIRPQDLEHWGHSLSGQVQMVERLGDETVVSFCTEEDQRLLAVLIGDHELDRHDQIGFSFDPEKAILFDEKGNAIYG